MRNRLFTLICTIIMLSIIAFLLVIVFFFIDVEKVSGFIKIIYNSIFKSDYENIILVCELAVGIFGSILSFLSFVLIFLTFRNQKNWNILERFESKFFDMVKMHRDNVSEIKVKDTNGRRVFVLLLRELREIQARLAKDVFNKYPCTKQKKLDICYKVLFYGVGPNSARQLECSLEKYGNDMTKEIIECIRRVPSPDVQIRGLNYTLFEGHQSRFGHYFRHLYQTICYVDKQSFLNKNEKYSYAKILRAQLSTHEQALLFINTLSDMGSEWRDNGFIHKYKLIKNLPKHFFDSDKEIDPKEVYPDLEFEWEE